MYHNLRVIPPRMGSCQMVVNRWGIMSRCSRFFFKHTFCFTMCLFRNDEAMFIMFNGEWNSLGPSGIILFRLFRLDIVYKNRFILGKHATY